MAFFVLVVVGLIVAQTWADWRRTRQESIFPDWAKGTALAGTVAVSLAAAAGFAVVWLQDSANRQANGFTSRSLWLQIAFVAAAMLAIVLAIRKERMRLLFLFAAAFLIVLWVSASFLS